MRKPRSSPNIERREIAARLVAQANLTHAEIAVQVGVAPKRIEVWQQRPDFRAAVQKYRAIIRSQQEKLAAKSAAVGADLAIADRGRRLEALQDRWQRMRDLIEERAKAYAGDAAVVGGRTGLVVKREKVSGGGVAVEVAFDRALVEELREHEKQAAQELGQWSERREVSVQAEGEFTLVELMAAWLKGGA